MAGIRGILAGLAIGSALVALPARANAQSSASLIHTVSVSVPSRVKVQLASFAVSTPVATALSSRESNSSGISLSVSASQPWVLAIRSATDVAAQQSALQWSPDGRSQFSAVTSTDVPVASGMSSYRASASNMIFRNAASAPKGQSQGETVVLTVTAP